MTRLSLSKEKEDILEGDSAFKRGGTKPPVKRHWLWSQQETSQWASPADAGATQEVAKLYTTGFFRIPLRTLTPADVGLVAQSWSPVPPSGTGRGYWAPSIPRWPATAARWRCPRQICSRSLRSTNSNRQRIDILSRKRGKGRKKNVDVVQKGIRIKAVLATCQAAVNTWKQSTRHCRYLRRTQWQRFFSWHKSTEIYVDIHTTKIYASTLILICHVHKERERLYLLWGNLWKGQGE